MTKRMCKEALVAQFNILSGNLLGGTEEDYERRQPVSRPRLFPGPLKNEAEMLTIGPLVNLLGKQDVLAVGRKRLG
jgi:hypothetical protein